MQKYRIFVKKFFKKSDKKFRFYWIKFFPQTPLSKKPLGLRMGKGPGKPTIWFSKICPGIIFMEFKGIRKGRAFLIKNGLRRKINTNLYIL